MDSLKLKLELSELDTLMDFIFKNYKEDYHIRLAVEELFVNIVNYSNADYLIVNVEYENELTITFIDNGIQFDPTLKETPKPPENPDEAQIGGLGIFFAKTYVDEMIYEYKNGENHLKIIKRDEHE